MMDNDNDFTFCQVSSPINQDGIEANKLASDMGDITIKDITIKEESSNASSSNNHSQNTGVIWMDGLRNNSTSKKQASVGSLSYGVIDTTPSNQAHELNTKAVSNDAENSLQKLSEQKKPMEKPTARVKVPFEKGYSQMDWLKITRSHPDLAGLKGQSNRRLISMDEVRQHQTEGHMWTVLKGRVYNISPYMKFHPGGVDMLMKAVGKDCTSLFNKYHAWVNAEFLLEKCLVGTLDDSQ